MLVWAREESDLTLEAVAKRMGIEIEKLKNWETGSKLPTYKQLAKLAREVYKRPSAIFFRKTLPAETPFELEFRTITSKKLHGVSAALRFAVRQARHMQVVQKEINTNTPPPFNLRNFQFDKDAPIEQTAKDLRAFLALDVEEQFQWKDHSHTFNALRARLEESGVCVVLLDFPLEEARGFTLSGKIPVIAINEHDSAAGRIFTLVHETCHVLMNVSSIFFDLPRMGGVQKEFVAIEKQCNAFAAAFLLPEPYFTAEAEKLFKEKDDWPDRKIARLANKFKTSKETVLRKLMDMDLASPTFYGSKRKRWKEEHEEKEKKKKEKLATAEKKGFGMPAHQRVVREKGKTFTSNVFQLYNKGKITALDAARYLDTRLDNFDKIIENL